MTYSMRTAPMADETSRTVATMPAWTQQLRNSAPVRLDQHGVAHMPASSCFDASTIAGCKTTLIDAAFNARLCGKCR